MRIAFCSYQHLRRLAAAVLAAFFVSFGAVACSSSGDDATSESAADGLTISHSFGDTKVPEDPQRIVTMSQTWADALVALDEPVLAEVKSSTTSGSQHFPWEDEQKLKDTEVIEYGSDMNEVSMEKILALKPDLILAGWVPDQEFYDRLSEIAPTVAILRADTGVDAWEDVTDLAGQITGKEQAAADLIAKVDGRLEQMKKDMPELEGKTFTWGMFVGNQFSVVSGQYDPSTEIFSRLGMKVAPKQVEASKGEARTQISAENVDLLDADFMLMWAIDGDPSSVPGYSELPVVKDGRTLRVGENESNATSLSSVSSLLWAMDRLEPALKTINDGERVQQLGDVPEPMEAQPAA